MDRMATNDALAATLNAPEPSLLSAESVARMLQVSVRTLWRLRSSGKLPKPVKVGGSVRWRADDVHQWIEAGCPMTRT
jgi:prophage regulatory protein